MSVIPENVQPGDFFAVSGGPVVGPLISFLEQIDHAQGMAAEFEHAGIVTEVAPHPGRAGNVITVEAQKQGAVEGPFGHWGQLIIWSTGVLEPQNRTAVVAAARGYAHDHVGYGWLDYAALAAHHFGWNFGWLEHFIDSSHTLICSQLVAKAWQAGKNQLFTDGRWPGDVKPSDLAQVLLDRGAVPLT